MKRIPSPNFNDRAPEVALDYMVLHYTGMPDVESALARLGDPDARVSVHYVVGEDGTIWNLVDESRRAWHAGKSFWRGVTDINSASVGIELVNPGHEFGYRPFPKIQIDTLISLAHEIAARLNLSPATALLGHSDVAPSRKEDPGELFPWKTLAENGLGLWPTPAPEDYAPAGENELESLLCTIGYDMTNPAAAFQAFHRRYRPEGLHGPANEETAARARALAALMPR